VNDVLVAYGSKLGGTAGLADGIAERLRERGVSVDLGSADEIGDVDGYKALIIGSAIYTSKWRPEVVHLLGKVAVTAPRTPLWLFHSGPLGEHAGEPQKLPKKVTELAGHLNIKGTMTFGGRLPDKPKGLMAKLVARTQAGDWRDFDDVGAWTDQIADSLEASDQPA
jgi:menaquinone-dependent protoporphyrinogen oxidase